MAIAQTRSREIQLFEPAQNALHTRKCRAAPFANQSPFFMSTTTEAMPSTTWGRSLFCLPAFSAHECSSAC